MVPIILLSSERSKQSTDREAHRHIQINDCIQAFDHLSKEFFPSFASSVSVLSCFWEVTGLSSNFVRLSMMGRKYTDRLDRAMLHRQLRHESRESVSLLPSAFQKEVTMYYSPMHKRGAVNARPSSRPDIITPKQLSISRRIYTGYTQQPFSS